MQAAVCAYMLIDLSFVDQFFSSGGSIVWEKYDMLAKHSDGVSAQ